MIYLGDASKDSAGWSFLAIFARVEQKGGAISKRHTISNIQISTVRLAHKQIAKINISSSARHLLWYLPVFSLEFCRTAAVVFTGITLIHIGKECVYQLGYVGAKVLGGVCPLENFDLRCSEMLFPSFWGSKQFCNLFNGYEHRKVDIFSYYLIEYYHAISFAVCPLWICNEILTSNITQCFALWINIYLMSKSLLSNRSSSNGDTHLQKLILKMKMTV